MAGIKNKMLLGHPYFSTKCQHSIMWRVFLHLLVKYIEYMSRLCYAAHHLSLARRTIELTHTNKFLFKQYWYYYNLSLIFSFLYSPSTSTSTSNTDNKQKCLLTKSCSGRQVPVLTSPQCRHLEEEVKHSTSVLYTREEP